MCKHADVLRARSSAVEYSTAVVPGVPPTHCDVTVWVLFAVRRSCCTCHAPIGVNSLLQTARAQRGAISLCGATSEPKPSRLSACIVLRACIAAGDLCGNLLFAFLDKVEAVCVSSRRCGPFQMQQDPMSLFLWLLTAHVCIRNQNFVPFWQILKVLLFGVGGSIKPTVYARARYTHQSAGLQG